MLQKLICLVLVVVFGVLRGYLTSKPIGKPLIKGVSPTYISIDEWLSDNKRRCEFHTNKEKK